MAGMNRETGRVLDGWEHVLQSLTVIFTTRFHERVMRRWFGSLIPHLLGESMVPSTVLRFYAAIITAVELWEPRYKISRVEVLELDRLGRIGFRLTGVYRPRAHLGDFTPEGARVVTLAGDDAGFLAIAEPV